MPCQVALGAIIHHTEPTFCFVLRDVIDELCGEQQDVARLMPVGDEIAKQRTRENLHRS